MTDYNIRIKSDAELQDLRRTSQEVETLRDRVTGLGQAIKTGLGVEAVRLASQGLGAIGRGFKDAIIRGIEFNAMLEQQHINFATLLGDGERATELMAELQEFAATTPNQLEEVLQSTRLLLAFGVEDTEIIPTLRAVGDVSAGVSARISEIAEIYGKARVQGTLFAEDINQLTGRGIPVISEFADILGVTESQVKNLASEGRITFPVLEQAFINMTSEGGRFFGLMEQQSQSLTGRLSTLRDNFDMAMGEATKDLFVDLETSVKSLTETMSDPDTVGAINSMIQLMVQLGEALITPIRGMNMLGNFIGDLATDPKALTEFVGTDRRGTFELNENPNGVTTFDPNNPGRLSQEDFLAGIGQNPAGSPIRRLGNQGTLMAHSAVGVLGDMKQELRATNKESRNLHESLSLWADSLPTKTDRIAGTLGGGMVQSINAVTQGLLGMGQAGQSMGDQLLGVLSRVLAQLLEIQITSFLLSNIFGGGGVSLQKQGANLSNTATGVLRGMSARCMATGGRPGVGETVFTGERGIELFQPDVPGRIIPSHEVGSHLAGQGQPVVVNQRITVNAGVSQTVRAEMYAMLPQLRASSVDAVREARARGDL